jgi:hypothetical protein
MMEEIEELIQIIQQIIIKIDMFKIQLMMIIQQQAILIIQMNNNHNNIIQKILQQHLILVFLADRIVIMVYIQHKANQE